MEMVENPIGFTTFPQPPPTPLFPSDFLPVQEKKLRDIFEGLKARRGTYIINRVLPYFSTSQISAYFHPAPDLTTRHILSIEFFPIFTCHYSLSRSQVQAPWTGFFSNGRRSSGTSPSGFVCTIATSQYSRRNLRFSRCCRVITTLPS